ncbi:hypothetical protein MD484_g8982, partial [Candolleomyces efflorescens]
MLSFQRIGCDFGDQPYTPPPEPLDVDLDNITPAQLAWAIGRSFEACGLTLDTWQNPTGREAENPQPNPAQATNSSQTGNAPDDSAPVVDPNTSANSTAASPVRRYGLRAANKIRPTERAQGVLRRA